MAKIDSAYSYYLNTYGSSAVSRYDTHKKSELRNTYNRIVKLNKESPLYKISFLGGCQKICDRYQRKYQTDPERRVFPLRRRGWTVE